MTRLMRAHVEGSIPDLIAARPDVPSALNEIHRRLMAKKAEDRFQTAAEVVDALEPFTRRVADSPDKSSVSLKVGTSALDITQTTAPVAGQVELGGDVDSPTMDIVASTTTQTSTKRQRVVSSKTKRQWLIAVGLLACVVLAAVFSGVGRVKKPTDAVANNASGSRSSTHPTDASSPKPKPLTLSPSSWHGWPTEAPPPAIAPFDAEQAKQHQEAWAKYLGVPVEYTNSLRMKFRLIPPGEFLMGSTPTEIEAALKDVGDDKHAQECIKSEAPQHKVILTQPIYLGVNEVTQAEYEKVMGTNPSHFALTGAGKEAVAGLETTDHPVEMVNWKDVAEFCAKLSKQEKLKPFYFRDGEMITPLNGTGYRLPSEAEWEVACRAGTATKYWIGDQAEDLVRAGWFIGNSGGRTHAACELKANPFGLYDIHGNVWEWVQDKWDATWYGQFQDKPAINPDAPFHAGFPPGVRGGNWLNSTSNGRSSTRLPIDPWHRYHVLGFRVSLTVEAVRQALKVTGPAMPKPVANTPSAPGGDAEKLPAKFTNRLGMEFVLVGKGTAWLGGGSGQQGEKKVEMSEDFYVGRYEVTQAEWEQVTGQTPRNFSRTGVGQDSVKDIPDADLKRFPVENVSWDDAQLFLERLNKQEPSVGWVYRLPKANEWEYACRGGPLSDKLDSAFYFDFDKPTNQLLPDQANFTPEPGKGLQRTCKVGSHQPNRLGLYDMHGNLHEWCDDEEKAADAAWHRLLRSGAWHDGPGDCRATYRHTGPSSSRDSGFGLRLARVPVGPAKPKPVANTPSAPANN